MISESNALQDIACEYDESDDDDFDGQIADKHFHRCWLGKSFSMWAALMEKSVRINDVSFFKAAVNPEAPGHLLRAAVEDADSYAVPSSDGQGETLEQLNSPCPWILASASVRMMMLMNLMMVERLFALPLGLRWIITIWLQSQ